MTEHTLSNDILMVADVAASVELYERHGDAEAFTKIAAALDRLRNIAERVGGQFVQTRGDDLLCAFRTADAAAEAAAAMLEVSRGSDVTMHLAMHAGEAIVARESIYGDAVNVTYRLATIANSGEVLATARVVEKMRPDWRRGYRPLRAFRFKGKTQPIDVFAYGGQDVLPMTQLPSHFDQPASSAHVVLQLRRGDDVWEVRDSESLLIGRAENADVSIPRLWVSRRHALLHVRDGVAMLTDRSSYGSFLYQEGAVEMRVRRSSVALSGNGVIALGTSHDAPEAECIEYAVLRAPDPGSPVTWTGAGGRL